MLAAILKYVREGHFQTMQVRPKKYLGQNFLVDKNIQNKIINACGITSEDTVVEIGAGRGELTMLLAQNAQRVIAVEVDSRLCGVLESNLAHMQNVDIMHQDILDFDIKSFFKNISKVKVIGNLPYNITTPIIVHLLGFRHKIDSIFLTVQKEFAQRIVAVPGTRDWSALSCLLQYYTCPRILFIIKKTCFWPKPKVDSAFVKLEMKSKTPLAKQKKGSCLESFVPVFSKEERH